MSRCKCPKSDAKPSEHSLSYFENITTSMEERRCDLLGRHKFLREKITTMERSIPALIAYNMWMSKKCDNAPYCKVREIMKRFVPYPDQTETLLKSLKTTVKQLNGETEELHEKIIQADVKLEETEMELESLELANKEMGETLNHLEKEVRSYTSPSLHSIHSEDLLCLSKIRQLAKEELNLKNCIKELEQKETIFNEHMNRLLTSKEYQNVCGRRKITSCIQDLDCTGKNVCYVPKKCLWPKQSSQHPKKKQEPEEYVVTHSDAVVSTSQQNIQKRDQETKPEVPKENLGKRTSWIPNWWSNNNQEPQEIAPRIRSADTLATSNAENTEIEKSIPQQPSVTEKDPKDKKLDSDKLNKSLKSKSKSKSKSAQCHRPCFTPQDLQCVLRKSGVGKYVPPCNIPCKKPFMSCAPRNPFCELPRYTMANHGMRTRCQAFPLSCDLKEPCEICPSSSCKDYPHPVRNCRCNCKGKCAHGLSDAQCNCNDDPLGPLEEYKPIGSKQLTDSRKEGDSEDEFCECCSCGCDDSDESLCQCN